ncbi:MAG: carboxypeptidase regulatory-like domain-containing protein [Planctomycetia bacterium]|nr:carboxypeptidase regulatory-like domain-containing protein [Planctomycetia bacterium]
MPMMIAAYLVGCLAVGAGCGPSRPATTTVTGSVTYGGKPVSGASVAFVPEKGAPAVGTTDASGNFSIPGALPGPAKVTIAKTAAGPAGVPANPTPADMAKMAAAASGKKPEAVKAEIPEKYGRVMSSDLKAAVTTDAKKNVFTFDLKD